MKYIFVLFLLSVGLQMKGQDQHKPDTIVALKDSLQRKATQIPGKYLSQVKQKTNKLDHEVTRRSEQALTRFMKQEEKMKKRLGKIDSLKAANLFSHSIDSLGSLKSHLSSKAGKYAGVLNQSGGAYLDSLSNSLAFLKDSKGLLDQSKGITDKLNGSLKSVDNLKDKLQQAEQIKAYIRERKQQLKEQLAQYTGFTKDLQKMNKEAYYYSQQLKEYKEVFKDKKKAEQKAMEVIRKIPAFNDFMRQHSQLASLFNIQGSAATAQSLEGLQTRSQVEQLIQQRIGSGPNASAAVSQQMAEARSKFDELKSKFPDLDNAADMPDFKPKEMKTKSFLQRLEFGSNLQFQRSTKFFPTTGDFAGQVAYKFHKSGSAGVGLAYKLGMGTGFNDIRFTSQGMGIRSFIDWKLKGTFFLNGGYEQNYQPGYAGVATGLGQQWTQSGLIGLSKKYKINSKMKGNMMVLFDFLYNQHVPRTDPVKVRLGYNF
ncbi:coiled-coil domain-containing protein [Chitinophaga sp. 30R24]|uniref:coiled-coil domain-containing protein n=1 Tax=Chitinophaga sp. 30R24 TaxID=3248838 RepID=UPI003B91683B